MKTYYSIVTIFLFILLTSGCTGEENPQQDETKQKLVVSADKNNIELGTSVTFEVKAEGVVIEDADIYVDGERIEQYEHQFSKIGESEIIAKKTGFFDSDPLLVTINDKPITVDIYVLGSAYHEQQDQSSPGYWKNGELQAQLQVPNYPGDLISSSFNGMTISNDQVYITGSTFLNGSDAVVFYWENNTYIPLTDRFGRPIVANSGNDIEVSNGTVYVAGTENTAPNVNNAVYWKNGEAVYLTNQEAGDYFSAFASSIDVFGDEVHVAGNIAGSPSYWKGTELTSLTGEGETKSIFVDSNGDVYIAGFDYNGTRNIAKYWKNGQEFFLGSSDRNSEAHSIFVENGDVYVAGFENIERPSGNGRVTVARYWKNGTAIDLTDQSNATHAYSIFVIEGNVFVAGTESRPNERLSAVYWHNGETIRLSDGSNRATANDIFVVKRR